MSEIQATAHLTIHEGKLDAFKAAVEQCVAIVKEKDTGTLQYDWFLNADETVCVVREHYTSSEAVLEHMGNLGEALPALLGVCDLSLEIYGSPSDTLLQALEGMGINYYSYLAGL